MHLLADPIMVVLPRSHPLAPSDAVDPSEVPASEWITTNVDVAALVPRHGAGGPQALDFEGQDFRTALNLVAAGLGVALLPGLALRHPPHGAIARPMARHTIVRRLHTARLDTTTVPAPVRRLEICLHDAVRNVAS